MLGLAILFGHLAQPRLLADKPLDVRVGVEIRRQGAGVLEVRGRRSLVVIAHPGKPRTLRARIKRWALMSGLGPTGAGKTGRCSGWRGSSQPRAGSPRWCRRGSGG